jgi:hypothetical protein
VVGTCLAQTGDPCGSPSSYDLLSVRHCWLRIGLYPSISFRFHGVWGWLWGYWPLVFYCTFFRRIWYDLCSICFILFRSQSWNNISSWLFNLDSGPFPYMCDYQIDTSHNGLIHLEREECSASWIDSSQLYCDLYKYC